MVPQVRELDEWGVRFCAAPDPGLDAFIERFVTGIPAQLHTVGPNLERVQFVISLYKNVKRGSFLGISTGVDKRVWERWCVSLLVNSGGTMPMRGGSATGLDASTASAAALGRGAGSPRPASPYAGGAPELVLPTPAVPSTAPAAAAAAAGAAVAGPGRAGSPSGRDSPNPFPAPGRGGASPVPGAARPVQAGHRGGSVAAAAGGGSVGPTGRSLTAEDVASTRAALRETMLTIASMACSRTAQVPPIDFDAEAPFFYKFEFEFPPPPKRGEGEAAKPEDGSWLTSVGKYLRAGPAPLRLGSA